MNTDLSNALLSLLRSGEPMSLAQISKTMSHRTESEVATCLSEMRATGMVRFAKGTHLKYVLTTTGKDAAEVRS